MSGVKKMKTGDRVTKAKAWKVQNPIGTVKSIKKDYVVVKWDEVPGEWHYTSSQAEELKIFDENNCG